MRHSLLVRITHWLTALSVAGLLVSGAAILIAHPRLYWGETGSLETPSLIDLPLTLTLGHSGWGRYLHFLSAWLCVLTGLIYVLSGLVTKHFRRDLLPARSPLAGPLLSSPADSYNIVQRVTYLCVVFVLFPFIVVTGLAMSPAVTSVMPWLATMFGGHQSARTIHFFAASAVTLFVIGHVTMVVAAGFAVRVMAMITGGRETAQEHV
ncbi:MAG TPA: cytochrome b/b6 domain-containing protein [Vicinamibacterales bacterium]